VIYHLQLDDEIHHITLNHTINHHHPIITSTPSTTSTPSITHHTINTINTINNTTSSSITSITTTHQHHHHHQSHHIMTSTPSITPHHTINTVNTINNTTSSSITPPITPSHTTNHPSHYHINTSTQWSRPTRSKLHWNWIYSETDDEYRPQPWWGYSWSNLPERLCTWYATFKTDPACSTTTHHINTSSPTIKNSPSNHNTRPPPHSHQPITIKHFNTPQHTSTHLNTPQQHLTNTSTHLNAPQHTSTHLNTSWTPLEPDDS